MRRLLLFTFSILILFSSCRRIFGKRIRGNGHVTLETRSYSGFHSISVSDAIDVYVRQDSMQSVKVETDENIQPYIDISESGGVLSIEERGNYNLRSTHGIKVYVSGTAFRRFSASGACDFFTQNVITSNEDVNISLSGSCDATMEIKSPRGKARLSGATTLSLKGETKDLDLTGTGSSTLKCMNMMADNVEVRITGAGNADVFANVKLDVHVTGAGSVRYKGTASVNQNVTGAGSVKKVE
jgi:hypothetical protein